MQSYNVLQLEEDVKCPLLVHVFGDDHGCAVIHEGHCFFHGHCEVFPTEDLWPKAR